MTDLLLLVLATFWAWSTLRLAVREFAPGVFDRTRPLHPLLVASLPLYVLWPDWVAALAVAGATGLLVATADRVFESPSVTPLPVPRQRTRSGLPPLP